MLSVHFWGLIVAFERFRFDAERPSGRLLAKVLVGLQAGKMAVVPTDSSYAFMCCPQAFAAQQRISQLRRLDKHHYWSLVCQDVSQAAQYVRIDNGAHRYMRRCFPGPYTMILPASAGLPKRVFGKRHDLGIRMPDHRVCQQLLALLAVPLLATSLQWPNEDVLTDPDEIALRLQNEDVLFLDAGWGGMLASTVVDFCHGEPTLIREGLGAWPC